MKPTHTDLMRATKRILTRLDTPQKQDQDFREEIYNELQQMAATVEQLDSFVNRLVNTCNKWPGFVEMRGAFCYMYRPADGIEVHCCAIAGFTAVDGERVTRERIALESGQKMLPPPDVTPEELAASEDARKRAYALLMDGVKRVPKAEKLSNVRTM